MSRLTGRDGKRFRPGTVATGVTLSATAARPSARVWLVWGVALLAYVVAVFHRASLAVTGPAAQERFSASAASVALFVVLQLAVYAAMQIPVGLAVDRYGPRRVILLGALTMAAGQATLALAGDVPTAVAARVLVGAGDAMTFISVLRIVSREFPDSRVPLMTQLTGLLGQAGQVLAAYPLVALLARAPWDVAFGGAAAVGVLVAVLVAVALRDAPPGVPAPPPRPLAQVRADLRATLREPGTRLGFFTHLSTQFSATVFGLLWGFPFLTAGQGLAPGTAAALLTVLVVASMAIGPLFGALCGRWPLRRSVIVFGIVGSTAAAWTAVLLWPGRAPLPLLVLLVLVLSTNGPGSLIGFDYARTENPASRLGSASGIVNVGGFVASLVVVLAIGVVLDLLAPAGATAYSLGALKAAFAVQYAAWAVGLAGVLHYRRVLRAQLPVPLAPLHRAVRARLRGGSAYAGFSG